MITKEIRKCDHRVGFSVIDIATGAEGILAHIHQQNGPKMGCYRVKLRDLEEIGIAAIDSALSNGTLVVIDEIAPMELTSPKFIPAVERVVESDPTPSSITLSSTTCDRHSPSIASSWETATS